MKILIIGDVVGRPGRNICKKIVPELTKEEGLDFVIINGENIAGGSGINEKTAKELFAVGADVITSGDHIFKSKNTDSFFHTEKRILRPANYAKKFPGFGSGLYTSRSGRKVGVINLIGRVFLQDAENPFDRAREEVKKLKQETPVIFVDLHAEATSEKIAMGWYLDGEVTGIFGTHTHVPTADERVLPKGTAYITDVGMTGSYQSILGREIKPVLSRFLTGRSTHFDVAKEDVRLMGIIVEVDEETGKAASIRRIEKT
jgi:metallophosphoesterase (TIGR00282 family)